MTPEPPADTSAQRGAEGSAELAASVQRLSVRLKRLEQQVRAFKELHASEVSDLSRRIQLIAQLHADELQLILAELDDIAEELATDAGGEGQRAGAGAGPSPAASPADPAAGSPKRARWLAEKEADRARGTLPASRPSAEARARPTRLSRRGLLRGRGEDS